MKSLFKLSLFSLIIITLASCNSSFIFKINSPKKVSLTDQVKITLTEESGKAFEKAIFFVNGKEVTSGSDSFTLNTEEFGVGKIRISAMVYYGENKSKRVNGSLEIFSNVPYQAYNYKIVNSYPHDGNAFTQGLEFKDGFLYESTGQRGKSTIRKVELKTGKVLQKKNIADRYFGEGITFLNDKLFFLTWQNEKGFIYNPTDFSQIGEFSYGKSKQGWGLTNNGTDLIKSDGTNKIWFLDAETQKEKRSIQAYTNNRAIGELNELEYINGKIFANYWQKPLIAIINPDSGIVEGIINLSELVKEQKKIQQLKQDDVLNGIAYDAENERLFVTGKNWTKLYEIELVKQ